MDIQEIPLDNPEKEETLPEIQETLPEIQETLPEKKETPPEKKETPPEIPDGILNVNPEIEAISVKAKRGRPVGSKSKAKAKPRARKVVIEEAPIEEDEHSATAESSYTPSSPKKDRMVNDVAVEVLRLLQNQTHVRQQKKRAQYASWFQ
jgi:hypothetical protein